jgi:hypothetical protein
MAIKLVQTTRNRQMNEWLITLKDIVVLFRQMTSDINEYFKVQKAIAPSTSSTSIDVYRRDISSFDECNCQPFVYQGVHFISIQMPYLGLT